MINKSGPVGKFEDKKSGKSVKSIAQMFQHNNSIPAVIYRI